MAKSIELKILQNFKDKENGKEYARNDKIVFSEKRAEELLKNPCLVRKIREFEEPKENRTENKTEKTSK